MTDMGQFLGVPQRSSVRCTSPVREPCIWKIMSRAVMKQGRFKISPKSTPLRTDTLLEKVFSPPFFCILTVTLPFKSIWVSAAVFILQESVYGPSKRTIFFLASLCRSDPCLRVWEKRLNFWLYSSKEAHGKYFECM